VSRFVSLSLRYSKIILGTLLPTTSQTDPNAMPSLVFGLCVPSSCDRHEIVALIHTYFKKSNVSEENLVCSNDPPNGQKGLTGGAIATIVILSLLGLLVSIGTIIELIHTSRIDSADDITSHLNGSNHLADARVNEPELVKLSQHSRYSLQAWLSPTPRTIFLAEFSALKSLRRIFTMKQKNDSDSFLFINGIRVLSLMWVIIGHSLTFGLSYSSNVLDVLAWTHNISFQLIINAVLSVDTFFVLSGFLTAILFVRQVKKQDKLSFRFMFMYYIHRYIRLTPAFLLMILISINLTPYFGHGPVYPSQQGFESNGCRTRYWWTSILYVSNLVKSDDMCLAVTWYLHNDMQFHWIAPLSLIPFAMGRKSFSFFITIIFVFIGIGSILTILLYYPDMSLNSLIAFINQVRFAQFFMSIISANVSFFLQSPVLPFLKISILHLGVVYLHTLLAF
jgi:peptidoglycan/LPS O-acetylase OafA/YrhL